MKYSDFQNVKSNLSHKDTLYLIKNGFVRRPDGQFDFVINYHETSHRLTYGVTLAINDKIVYVTFNWGKEYVKEAIERLKDLPSGPPTHIVDLQKREIFYSQDGVKI